MSDPATLLIAHAGCANTGCTGTLQTLQLPALAALLAELTPDPPEQLPDEAFDTPEERVLARALGLAAPDGHIPWAARLAAQAGLAHAGAAWALFTPCRFDVGMREVRLSDPHGLSLEPAHAQALTASMAPYFAEDGIALQAFTGGHWLASGELFRDLATASLARVTGEDLNPWMPASPLLRRLQNEMQMLLYTHHANSAREAAGLPPVNALWVSGCGPLPPQARIDAAAPETVQTLREPALDGDWQAWATAWRAVDQQHCAPLLKQHRQGKGITLALCGPRSSQTWRSAPRSAFSRLAGLMRKPRIADVLGRL